jgi:hypothetical protein
VFLATPLPEGLEGNGGLPPTDHQRADSLGATELVSREAEEIDRGVIEIDRDVSHRLSGVAVEPGTPAVADLGELGDGIDGSNFVVGPHDRNEPGGGGEGLFEQVGGDLAVGIDGDEGEWDALPLEAAGGVEHSPVFDCGNSQAGSLRESPGDTFEGEIVGLGGSTGEEDLAGFRTEEAGDLGAGGFERVGGLATVVVALAGGVAKLPGQPGPHRLGDAGGDGGGGVTIEKDRLGHTTSCGAGRGEREKTGRGRRAWGGSEGVTVAEALRGRGGRVDRECRGEREFAGSAGRFGRG